MKGTIYTSINLPVELVEELKVWKTTFCNAYGRNVTYGEMLNGMLDDLELSRPNVADEMRVMLSRHPELCHRINPKRLSAIQKKLS